MHEIRRSTATTMEQQKPKIWKIELEWNILHENTARNIHKHKVNYGFKTKPDTVCPYNFHCVMYSNTYRRTKSEWVSPKQQHQQQKQQQQQATGCILKRRKQQWLNNENCCCCRRRRCCCCTYTVLHLIEAISWYSLEFGSTRFHEFGFFSRNCFVIIVTRYVSCSVTRVNPWPFSYTTTHISFFIWKCIVCPYGN